MNSYRVWDSTGRVPDLELRGGHRLGDISRFGVVLEGAAQGRERFPKLMRFDYGGLSPRQSEQKVRGLFIGRSLRTGQGYVPGDQAPFKMSLCSSQA